MFKTSSCWHWWVCILGGFLLFHPRKTPIFPVPEKHQFSPSLQHSNLWGWGQLEFWGFFGFVPKISSFLGLRTGKEPLKTLGMLWGRGNPKFWGFFGGKFPKIYKFWGWGRGKILGDFPTTTRDYPQAITVTILNAGLNKFDGDYLHAITMTRLYARLIKFDGA